MKKIVEERQEELHKIMDEERDNSEDWRDRSIEIE